MVRLIILSFLMSGCATLRKPVAEAVGSPCFDGIMINLRAEECMEISMVQIPGTPILRTNCKDFPSSQDDEWSRNYFYFVPSDYEWGLSDWTLICRDPGTNAFYSPRVEEIVPTDTDTDEGTE